MGHKLSDGSYMYPVSGLRVGGLAANRLAQFLRAWRAHLADVFGRRKDGSRIAPGAVSQGLAALARGGRAQARALTEAGSPERQSALRQFLAAWRTYFGQVLNVANKLRDARSEGKLGAAWEAHMDELLGQNGRELNGKTGEGLTESSGEGGAMGGETYALRKGASLNSQKKFIPKMAEKMPKMPVHGSFEEILTRIVDWMKANPTATAPDGKKILIENPEGGSLEKRAEHWMASYATDDPWRKDDRRPKVDKLESIGAIASTINGAQVAAIASSGKTIYLRRYSDNKLHAVFVDKDNRVTEHGLIDGSVATQFTLDPTKGIEGAKVVQDWTTEAPAYSVNPAKGAESDRASTPGRPPTDQQGSTSAPSAHGYLTAEGDIVKSSPARQRAIEEMNSVFGADDSAVAPGSESRQGQAPTFSLKPRPYAEAIKDALKGRLPANAILDLGKPGEILRHAGLPDLPMLIRQSTVRRKTAKHDELTEEVLKGLPDALNSPMAVYTSPGDKKAHAILTTIPTSQGPVTAYFSVRDYGQGDMLEAKTVFGKDPGQILPELIQAQKDGLISYTNKEAFDNWSAQARGLLADASHQHHQAIEGLRQFFTQEQGKSKGNTAAAEHSNEMVGGDAGLFQGRENETSFSLAFVPRPLFHDAYHKKLDLWERGEDIGRTLVPLGPTPPVLRVAGAEARGLYLPPSLFDKVTQERHAVPIDAMRNLLGSLYDPVAVFQSRTHADSLLVLTEFMEPGQGPVLAAVTLDKAAGRGLMINEVASVYGKPAGTIAQMFGENPLYENKEKSLVWARRVGQLLPKRGRPSQDQNRIPGPAEVVKWVEGQKKGTPPPNQ